MDNHRPERPLIENHPVDLFWLESTKPIDEHSKFRGWSDWEALVKEPLHNFFLSGNIRYAPKRGCSRAKKGDATISEYTLSGKSSFCVRSGSTEIVQAFHLIPAIT